MSSDGASVLGVCSLLEVELKLRRLRVKPTSSPIPKHRIARDDTKSGLEDENRPVWPRRVKSGTGGLLDPNEMTATLIHAEN